MGGGPHARAAWSLADVVCSKEGVPTTGASGDPSTPRLQKLADDCKLA